MHHFAYTIGKNSTDSAFIIDAMDLLHASNLDDFFLVLRRRCRWRGCRI